MSTPPKLIVLAGFMLMAVLSYSQEFKLEGTSLLDKLILEERIQSADSVLTTITKGLLETNSLDSLCDYIFYTGRVAGAKNQSENGLTEAIELTDIISGKTNSKKTLKQAQLELGSFYEYIHDNQSALECNLKALKIAEGTPGIKAQELALIEGNIGIFYLRSDRISLAREYYLKSHQHYYSDPETTDANKYRSNNSMGGIMWYQSKYDSALVYYTAALNIVQTLDSTPRNLYYRPALLYNNMAGLSSINGNVNESISSMENAIGLMRKFLASDVPAVDRAESKELYFQLIDNLGGAFKELGDYQKAKNLIEFAFNKKKENFSPESQEIFRGNILMGQIELSLNNFTEAEEYLLEGIRLIEKYDGQYGLWKADAHFYLSSVYRDTDQPEKAMAQMVLAEQLFKQYLDGSYDQLFLDFIIHAAPYYAKNGNGEKALQLATDALNYMKENSGEKSIVEYSQRLNLAEVHYLLGNYDQSITYSEESLDYLDSEDLQSSNRIDSIRKSLLKPLAITLSEKSKLEQNPNLSSAELRATYERLLESVQSLENRRAIYSSDEAVAALFSDYSALLEFTERISYKLYELTQEEVYLDRIINLNESAIYNRIRERLSTEQNAQYKDVPQAVLEKENELKEAINLSLSKEEDADILDFFDADKQWSGFLETLKQDYPKYYKLKYETIERSLANIQNDLADHTTLIRYFFIEESLYALVIDKTTKEIIPLDYSIIKDKIELIEQNEKEDITLRVLHELHNELWKPLSQYIKHKSVVVIPERELFNVSFESLLSKPVDSWSDVLENSLLTRYFISYNYSLFLISDATELDQYQNNLAAFAPEFTEEMKTSYENTLSDSLFFDYSYLKLLPQPFAKDLAIESANLFGGNTFLNSKSTTSNFMQNAGGNKIIFIGTHAESNNISPELSRLIFSKEENSEVNSLYNYQLYNCDLSSNLAVLTACETGKPSYQPGEGMISMAHAFNYAGSQSILTSLWKIDEKASVDIIEHFYQHLAEGLAKDEALQRAKIDYLKTAEGRTLSPKYWSGLILVGDTQPINIKGTVSLGYWIILAIAILGLIAFMLYRAKKKTSVRPY